MEDIMKKLIEWLKSFFGYLSMDLTVDEVKPIKATEPKKAAVVKGPAVKYSKDAKPTAITKAQLNKLTKAKIEEEGRKLGIEVDKRKKKAELVDQVFKASKEVLK